MIAPFRRLGRQARALFSRGALEHELDEELRLHIDLETEQLVREGHPRNSARRMAERAFGQVERVKDEARDERGVGLIEDLMRDARFALRTLASSRGFTAIAALTIALAIAGVTTVFSAFYGVLFAPLAYRDADRIVTIWQTDDRRGLLKNPVSPPNFLDLRSRSVSFEAMAAAEPYGMDYAAPEGTEHFSVWRVTAGFFETLGARALLGRTFSPDDYRAGQDAVVVLDYDLWRSRFGGDRSIVGRKLVLDGMPRSVIGVMPNGFRYPAPPGFWAPKIFSPEELQRRNAAYYLAVGRLRDGTNPTQAAADDRRVATQLQREYPSTNRDVSLNLVPLREDLVGPVRSRLVLLMSAVALVLVIACANLLALMLARMLQREREFALRVALGAGSGQLLRQQLVECFLLGGLGGATGLAIAFWGVGALRTLSAAILPRIGEIRVSPVVVAFSIFATFLATALFGVAPALQVARRSSGISGIQSRSISATRGRRRLQDALVVAELAIAMVLLSGAGLLVHSFISLYRVDRGFSSTNIAAVTVQTWSSYPAEHARAAYVRALEAAVAGVPGVDKVGMTTALPLGATIGPDQATVEIVGRPATSGANGHTVHAAAITPNYFSTLSIPLRRGRAFAGTDNQDHVPVAIVNEVVARAMFLGEDPIGQRLRIAFAAAPVVREIVGVVADVRDVALHEPPRPTVFVPHGQSPIGANTFVVRTTTDVQPILPSIRRAFLGVNGSMPIASVTKLDALVAESVRDRRFVLILVAGFAAAALVLAIVGVYGLISRLTAERTRELGIRIAMGARPADVFRLVLRHGLALALLGTMLGVAGALGTGRAIAGMLFGVTPIDALSLSIGACTLLCAALLATYIPARRATRIDVTRTLRDETGY